MAHIVIPKHVKKLLKTDIVKLDIGCGANKQPGFIGIDIRKLPGVDIVHDIETYPWPLPSGCATLAMAGHVVEHINPLKFGFIKFMNEVWRVLKYDGQFFFSTPYPGSRGYWADPTHINPVSKDTLTYFDPMNPLTYEIYRPLPWKVEKVTLQTHGNMEVLMVKRRIDKSYNCLYDENGKELA